MRPHVLVDVQLAAAFVGLEYPAAYGTLISKLLGRTLSKGETRTDWRRRPLTENQLTYALQDVVYLATWSRSATC
jgi:ribonuclease D